MMLEYSLETFRENREKCTEREREVIHAIRDNITTSPSKLSKILNIEVRTVHNHLHNILAKFELDNREKLFYLISRYLYVFPRQGERRTIKTRILYPFHSLINLNEQGLYGFVHSAAVSFDSKEKIKLIIDKFVEELNNQNYQIKQHGANCSIDLIIREDLKLAYNKLLESIKESEIYWGHLISTTADFLLNNNCLEIELKEKRRKK